jgi:hypothetical protein
MMMVPEAANMPPTPWQTEILASGIWTGAAVAMPSMSAGLRRRIQSMPRSDGARMAIEDGSRTVSDGKSVK